MTTKNDVTFWAKLAYPLPVLWYKKFRGDLEGIGFEFNDYDPCVANRMVNKRQHTNWFHVDDVLSSHVDPEVNKKFGAWENKTYGRLTPVELHRGKTHEFLGMTLDYSKKGECHILQEHHVKDIVSAWPEDLKQVKHVLTPSSNDLLKGGTGRLLSREAREVFHSIIAKFMFTSSRARPDIAPTIYFLSGRVRQGVTNKDDWAKYCRLAKYLDSTHDLHLIIHYDGLSLARWYVDAFFVVHDDFKSQLGGAMPLSDTGRAIVSGSNKQKLNTHSSTESELVSADDFLPKLLWTGKLMKAQGFNITSTLFQDNMSTMIIEKRVDALWVSEAMLLMYGFFNEGQRGEKRFEN